MNENRTLKLGMPGLCAMGVLFAACSVSQPKPIVQPEVQPGGASTPQVSEIGRDNDIEGGIEQMRQPAAPRGDTAAETVFDSKVKALPGSDSVIIELDDGSRIPVKAKSLEDAFDPLDMEPDDDAGIDGSIDIDVEDADPNIPGQQPARLPEPSFPPPQHTPLPR